MFGNIGVQVERLRARRKSQFGTATPTDTAKLMAFYNRVMTKATDSERGSVFIHDPKRNLVWLKAGTGVDERDIEVPKEGSIVGRVIASGKPVMESGLEAKEGAHKQVQAATGFVTRSILCVPIKSPERGEVTGAFQLLNKKENGGFTGDDLNLAEEIAEHLQLEVERIFLDQETFGVVERLYSAVKTTLTLLVLAAVAVIVLAGVVLLGYIVVPGIMG